MIFIQRAMKKKELLFPGEAKIDRIGSNIERIIKLRGGGGGGGGGGGKIAERI